MTPKECVGVLRESAVVGKEGPITRWTRQAQ